jgi:hypothetical protein
MLMLDSFGHHRFFPNPHQSGRGFLTQRNYMNKLFALGAVSAFALSGSLAFANITSTTDFGALPPGAFGGVGNPVNAVEITTATDSSNSDVITLGLAAQQRYFNPALTNNGSASDATYFATPGVNDGNPATPNDGAHAAGSTWDFDFYVNIAGGDTLSDYKLLLLYDFTPGTNTPNSELGTINLDSFYSTYGGIDTSTATSLADTENLDFAFLTDPLVGLTPPAGGSTTFNPLVSGEYTFKLELVNSDNVVEAQSDINVDVGSLPTPDGASTITVLGASFLAMGFCFRRNRSQSAQA